MKKIGDFEYKVKYYDDKYGGEIESTVYVQLLQNDNGHILINRWIGDEENNTYIFKEEIVKIAELLGKVADEMKKKEPVKYADRG